MSTGYLSAKQAASRLGVSVSTLYAYVSRGLIRSEPDQVKRRRRYRAEDVEALLARKQDKGGAERALAGALHWGEPLCESELTLIQDGALYYRGRNAAQLAQEQSLEEVASLLWGDYQPARIELDPALREQAQSLEPLARFRFALPWLERAEELAYDLREPSVQAMGARIMRALFTVASWRPSEGSLVESLSESWAPAGRRLLEAALILCADHELNVSAFTARCVASAGANPYQVVAGGLAALSGFRHGGYSYRVEAFLDEMEQSGPLPAIQARLRRGESVPGFGHPLYPDGDPRATALLGMMELEPPVEELFQRVHDLMRDRPNIDFDLVALSRHMKLPPGAPVGLFALGRTVGWIAHALEQYRSGKLIRPRARYVGSLPA